MNSKRNAPHDQYKSADFCLQLRVKRVHSMPERFSPVGARGTHATDASPQLDEPPVTFVLPVLPPHPC